MTERVEPRPLTASTEVAASPATVWRVVSDVRRTGEWSSECWRVLPLGPVRVGALLVGLNHRERVRWATVSRVITFTPEREIGWCVLTNRSEWRYQLQPSSAGTTVTQTRRTPRGEGRFAMWFTRVFLGGQEGHDIELAEGMDHGLARIKAIAEAVDHASRSRQLDQPRTRPNRPPTRPQPRSRLRRRRCACLGRLDHPGGTGAARAVRLRDS